MSNQIAMELKNVTKGYRDGVNQKTILDNTSCKIYKGEYVVLKGRSGLGKSTLLKLAGTLEKPCSGNVFVNGKNVTNIREKQLYKARRQEIGFVFQQFYLINRYPIQENLELPMFFTGIENVERKKRLKETLKMLGLAEKTIFQKVSTLSGGEKQRVAIGRAIINRPLVLLADEPTGSLDEKNEEQVLDIFNVINKEIGTTILVVTHNEKVAERAGRKITISSGKIVDL